MSYATLADIVAIYGDQVLYVADRDGDGVAETAAVDRALDAASAEIDSNLSARYALPLDAVPPILREICVDLAVYRLASSRDVLTADIRQRREDAVKHLGRIGEGKAGLGLASPDDDEDGQPDSPRPIVIGGPERLFSRDKMEGL